MEHGNVGCHAHKAGPNNQLTHYLLTIMLEGLTLTETLCQIYRMKEAESTVEYIHGILHICGLYCGLVQ